jgi:hypothetical protein
LGLCQRIGIISIMTIRSFRTAGEGLAALLLVFLLMNADAATSSNVVFVASDAVGADDGSSWTNAYKDLATALDNANTGNQLWVKQGTYTGELSMVSGVDMFGGFSGTETCRTDRSYTDNLTVLDGQNTNRVINGADQAILDGFIVANGWVSGTSDKTFSGAGMRNINVSPTIRNCSFKNNRAVASGSGGAMLNMGILAGPIIVNCRFSDNSAGKAGGAMYNWHQTDSLTNITILQCTFVGNDVGTGAGGAMVNDNRASTIVEDSRFLGNLARQAMAIYNNGPAEHEIRRCTFAANVAGNSGATLKNLTGARVQVEDCIFSGNRGGIHGGGIYNDHRLSSSTVIVSRCTFAGNDGRFGGAMYQLNTRTYVEVVNCLFVGNEATKYEGGAIFADNGVNIAIRHSTFSGNHATKSLSTSTGGGGAIGAMGYDTSPSGPITVQNSILWGDTSNKPGSEEIDDEKTNVTVSASVVQGGFPGTGVLNTDPGFVGTIQAGTWTALGHFNPDTGCSVVTDSAGSYTPNRFAGKILKPKTDYVLQYYIASNTETSITVYGNATTDSLGNYVVEPGGAYEVVDYDLSPGSTILDGAPDISVTDDLLGRTRPFGANPDMGAFEYAPDLTAPDPVSGLGLSPADQQITLGWVNPIVSDLAGILITRKQGSAPAGTPVDGTGYIVGNTIGGDPVVFIGFANAWLNAPLVNGTDYHYALFAFDLSTNFSEAATGNETPNPLPHPAISSVAATGIQMHGATFNGTLISTGASPTQVSVYWGTNDAGSAMAGWMTNDVIGVPTEGALSLLVTGLLSETAYYYRFYATNAASNVWAETSTCFTTVFDPSAYAHRMRIPAWTYTCSEPLENFPMLVRLKENTFFDYDHFLAPGDADLRFTDSNMTEVLSYETENWNVVGNSHVWVKFPELTPKAFIWALWGNPDAAVPAYTQDGSTWSGNFRAVWHLNDTAADGASGATNHVDATANDNDGVQRGNSDVNAVIDRGQNFDTGEQICVADAASLSEQDTLTLSAWIKIDSHPDSYGVIFNKGNNLTTSSAVRNYSLRTRSNNKLHLTHYNGAFYDLETGVVLSLATWHHVAAVIDSSADYRAIYLDGTRVLEDATAIPALQGNVLDLKMGAYSSTIWERDGQMDEARIAASARSSNWIWAAWANQLNPSTFAPLGIGWPLPAIENRQADNVTFDSALVKGSVLSTGAAPAQVTLYYGKSNGGTTPGSWEESVPLGFVNDGPLANAIGGLDDTTLYYFRYRISSVFGDAWAESSATFKTRLNLFDLGGTNYLGENMGFESPGVNWGVGLLGDPHAYVTAGLDGITPLEGARMVQGQATGGGVNFDLWGRIDLSKYSEAFTNGNVKFIFNMHFNRASFTIDTAFFGGCTFYDDGGVSIGNFGWDPTFANMLISDADPNTWESGSLTNTVPAQTTEVRIRLAINENIQDDAVNELLAHYYDDIQFALVFPFIEPPKPKDALLLLIR